MLSPMLRFLLLVLPHKYSDTELYKAHSIADDFPEPETPATQTIMFSGIFKSIFFRLLTAICCNIIQC